MAAVDFGTELKSVMSDVLIRLAHTCLLNHCMVVSVASLERLCIEDLPSRYMPFCQFAKCLRYPFKAHMALPVAKRQFALALIDYG